MLLFFPLLFVYFNTFVGCRWAISEGQKVAGVQFFQTQSHFSKVKKIKKIGCYDKTKSSITLSCCNTVMGLQSGCCGKADTLLPILWFNLHKTRMKFGMVIKLGCKCTFYVSLGIGHTYFQSSSGLSSVCPPPPIHQ